MIYIFKSVLRSFYKHKLYISINLFGLILGLTCSIVIFLYVSFQLSFDTFHNGSENIFRVNEISITPDSRNLLSNVRIPVGPALKDEFIEVEDFVRVDRVGAAKLLEYDKRNISVEKVLYADSNFFNFFSFEVKMGKPGLILKNNNGIVLTENVSERLFGTKNPIGTVIHCDNKPYEVTGIIKSAPINSHIQFDIVFPIEPIITDPDNFISWRGGMSASTFLRLRDKNLKQDLEAKFPKLLWEKVNKDYEGSGFFSELVLEPLNQIHLYSEVDSDPFNKKKARNIIILFFIGCLILLIAIVNYILISSGTLSQRLKEFQVKKYLGVHGNGIAKQIQAESVLLFFVAGIVSFFIIISLENTINQLFDYKFIVAETAKKLHYLIFIILVVSFISGLIQYFSIRNSISGSTIFKLLPINLKKERIAFFSALQFCISIALISSMIVVYKQLNFALHKDLGFKPDNIINIVHESIGKNSSILISEMKKIPGVINVSASDGIPGLEATSNGYRPEGSNQSFMFNAIHVDNNFFGTFQIKLIEGRNFKDQNDADNKVFIINKTLGNRLNWENAVGKKLFRDGEHQIIGVVEDFHVSSIYEKIPSLIISKEWQENFYSLSIALKSDNINETLKRLESTWSNIMTGTSFNYSFLDEKFAKMYADVQRTMNILLIFTFISILISVLGVFGITFLLINSKIKEIGIRKVNGAKTAEIMAMLNLNYVRWLLLAFSISTPISWYVMNKWLENFAYKTELSWWIFALSGLFALFIALVTVSWQSWRAANRNPVEALRYE